MGSNHSKTTVITIDLETAELFQAKHQSASRRSSASATGEKRRRSSLSHTGGSLCDHSTSSNHSSSTWGQHHHHHNRKATVVTLDAKTVETAFSNPSGRASFSSPSTMHNLPEPARTEP